MTYGMTQAKARSGLVAALDVGTTKVCCLIAHPGEFGAKVIGIGHHVSHGLRSGAVVDMDAAETSIRAAVEASEKMAGENIRRLVVNLSAGSPRSRLVAYEISIAGHQIGDADMRRIFESSHTEAAPPRGRETIHAIPVGYTIDGHRGIRDPLGMFGERLGVNLHLVTAASGALRNLETTVARCHLEVEDVVVSPYAAALAALVKDEMALGVSLVDMGGGTTSIAVFFDGELVHTDSIPIGGVHVTSDIARGLSTPISHAERIKTLYGSAIASPSDDREVINVPLIGEEGAADISPVPRSMLVGIIRPRIEEVFDLVRDRLRSAGFDQVAGRRVVLTGGASQLTGVRELASAILEKEVRMARPRPLPGLAEAVSGPAFATAIGLLAYAIDNRAEVPKRAYRPMEDRGGPWGRLGQWFRESF